MHFLSLVSVPCGQPWCRSSMLLPTYCQKVHRSWMVVVVKGWQETSLLRYSLAPKYSFLFPSRYEPVAHFCPHLEVCLKLFIYTHIHLHTYSSQFDNLSVCPLSHILFDLFIHSSVLPVNSVIYSPTFPFVLSPITSPILSLIELFKYL